MQKRGSRICPCCGKQLVFIGKVLGDKYREAKVGQRFTDADNYREVFEKDNFWVYYVDMFCTECRAQIKLQRNPITLFKVISCLVALTCMLTFFITVYFSIDICIISLLIGFVIEVVCGAVTCIEMRNIHKYRSNFLFKTDGEGFNSTISDVEFEVSNLYCTSKTADKLMYPANIFSVEFSSQNVHLFLTKREPCRTTTKVFFRICGNETERNCIKSSLQACKNEARSVTLRFEGRKICDVYINEICDCLNMR